MMSDAINAVILGVIEGVTEFLPVSSTGHLLLAERFFNLGAGRFWDTFTVLIQLGAILGDRRHLFRQIVAGRARHVHQSRGPAIRHRPAGGVPAGGRHRPADRRLPQDPVQSVGGVFLADRRRRHPVVGRSARSQSARARRHQISAADVSFDRRCAVPCDDSRRVALRRQHRGGDAVRLRQARGGGVFVLPGDPDHGRRLRLRFLQEPRRDDDRSSRHHRDRIRRVVRRRDRSW